MHARSRWRFLVAATVGALLLPLGTGASAVPPATPVPSTPPAPAGQPATSAGLATARARAAALNAVVDRLRLQAEQSTEAYNAVTEEAAQLTAQAESSARDVDDLRAGTARVRAENTERVRRLYQSQGRYGLLGALFAGGSPNDVLDRAEVAAAVIDSDAASVAAAEAGAREGADIASVAAALHQRHVQLAGSAAQHAARVRQALAGASAALDSADAEVRRVAEADRIAAEAAAARAFAARLAAAQRTAARQAAAARATAEAAVRWPAPAGGGLIAAGTPALPPPTAVASAALDAARSRLGLPYLWAAVGPNSFDCSGLTGWSYRQAGLSLPRTSREQWYAGPHPSLAQLAPGDLLFWASNTADPASIHHVALYLGGGLMIAAPRSGDVVKVQPVYGNGYIGAVRPTAA